MVLFRFRFRFSFCQDTPITQRHILPHDLKFRSYMYRTKQRYFFLPPPLRLSLFPLHVVASVPSPVETGVAGRVDKQAGLKRQHGRHCGSQEQRVADAMAPFNVFGARLRALESRMLGAQHRRAEERKLARATKRHSKVSRARIAF